MTKKQLNGLVDCLTNVCAYNTNREYSLSVQETNYGNYYNAKLLVFNNEPYPVFSRYDLRELLALANIWRVSLFIISLHGVAVAKFT